jgi:O-antigen ligase
LDYLLDETGHASDTLRMSGFIGDPNYCGMLIVMSIALLCVLYFYKKIKNEFWLFIVFLIPLGFFTYSKSYFLCVSVLVFFLIVTVLIPKHKIWGLISIFAVAIVISMALSGKIEIINTILERFLADDITTGRSDLNNYYLHYIWNNPMTLIFGEGMSADRIVSAGNNVHNFYIDAVFKFGLVGCLIFILTLCSSIGFTIDKKEKRKFVNYIPLIFLVVLYFALAGITRYELPFYVAIVFLSINFNSLNEDKTKERTLLKEIKENE